MGWQLQCIGASTTCNELHWRSALMFVQVALGQCTALVCRVHSGDYPSVKWCRQSNRGGKQGPLSSFDPPKLCPPMQNTNTKQFWIQIPTNAKYKYKNAKYKYKATQSRPTTKLTAKIQIKKIAKDCEGCPVSLSVSQVNFINVMIWVSQFVKICHE